jgi:uncharacterized protein
VIAVDTNILVYSHRVDSPFHEQARDAVKSLAQGDRRWAIAWPSIHEFIGVVTHPKILTEPSTLVEAFRQIEAWQGSESLLFLSEGINHYTVLRQVCDIGKVRGPMIHDARIAAICIDHGVSELWSADRDFSRFPQIKVKNPLIE